jgi:hypothetical protein
VQGSGSRSESTCGICGGSPQNHQVTWLSHKTKTGGSTGGDGIRARREASMSVDTWRDRRACVGRTQTATMAWSCDEELCYMTHLLLRGLYHNLSARGSLVFLPGPVGLIYINSTFSGQTILLDCFSFPCSIGVDFLHLFVENLSSQCMEAFMVVLISFL